MVSLYSKISNRSNGMEVCSFLLDCKVNTQMLQVGLEPLIFLPIIDVYKKESWGFEPMNIGEIFQLI